MHCACCLVAFQLCCSRGLIRELGGQAVGPRLWPRRPQQLSCVEGVALCCCCCCCGCCCCGLAGEWQGRLRKAKAKSRGESHRSRPAGETAARGPEDKRQQKTPERKKPHSKQLHRRTPSKQITPHYTPDPVSRSHVAVERRRGG